MSKNVPDKKVPLWLRFVKFGIVGGSGVIVNLGIYFAMTRGFDLMDSWLGRSISYALSVEVSIIANFILNDIWTFADRRNTVSWRTRFVRFHLVSFVGMGINWGVFAALNWLMLNTGFEILGSFNLLGWSGNIDDLIAACLGIGAAMMWNFFANLLWTWREK